MSLVLGLAVKSPATAEDAAAEPEQVYAEKLDRNRPSIQQSQVTVFRRASRQNDSERSLEGRIAFADAYENFARNAKLSQEVDEQVRWILYQAQVATEEMEAMTEQELLAGRLSIENYPADGELEIYRLTRESIRKLLSAEQWRLFEQTEFRWIAGFVQFKPLDAP